MFSFAFLGEALTPLMLLGMGLVLVGVFFVQTRAFPAPRPKDSPLGAATERDRRNDLP